MYEEAKRTSEERGGGGGQIFLKNVAKAARKDSAGAEKSRTCFHHDADL